MKDEFLQFLEVKRNEWNEIKEERRKIRGKKINYNHYFEIRI